MRRRQSADNTLAMLDLLSCAFGGVIVLAIVLAALMGSRDAVDHQSYLVVDAWIRPADSEPITPEMRSFFRQLELGLRVWEPGGRRMKMNETVRNPDLYRPVSGPEKSKIQYQFAAGGAEPGAFATLLGDRVGGGRYEIRLCLANASNDEPPEFSLDVGLRVRYPSRTGSGLSEGGLSEGGLSASPDAPATPLDMTSLNIFDYWSASAEDCEDRPLLKTRVYAEP